MPYGMSQWTLNILEEFILNTWLNVLDLWKRW